MVAAAIATPDAGPYSTLGAVLDGLPVLASVGPEDVDSQPRTMVILRPDGQRQRLETWFIPLRDQDGHLLGVTLLVTEP